MSKKYVPDRGDVVWLQFNPQSGHEQAGFRPALILSPISYNSKVGLAVVCPITSQIKGYPFEVPIAEDKIQGVVLADQIKNIDWVSRNAKFICKTNLIVIQQVIGKFNVLLS